MKTLDKILILLSVIFIGYFLGLILPLNWESPFKKQDNPVELRNELNYWYTKAQIVDEMEKYMGYYAPDHNVSAILVLKYADHFNIDPRIFLVQGLAESHYGTKGLARRTNSVCNVGAWDDGTIKNTYTHPDRSIKPYFELLAKQYLVNKTEEDLLKEFINTSGNRYASYVHYEKELQKLWEDVNQKTKLDSLLGKYRYFKLKFNR